MTLKEFVALVNGRDCCESGFFSKEAMQFFGDTMGNYKLNKKTVMVRNYLGKYIECYELQRKKPVKNGLKNNAYFNIRDFHRVIECNL